MPKITQLIADTTPTSDDLTVIVNDPAGTPGTKKATLANVITKAHGLTDGIVSAGSGTLNTTLSLDTDTTLAANSDTRIASQKAVKTYTDNILGNANALVYKGTIDCSSNPNYPAADAGFLYVVSVAGKIGGASGIDVEVGDMAICNTDGTASGNQATVGQYWNVIQKNIVGAVTGPASAVTDNIAVFDGTTGKVIKDGGAKTADFITKALIDAKGDLIVGSADNTPSILTSSGSNGNVLTVDTSTATGLKWAAPAGGGQTLYDKVVATSGGDYTTLGAALAAASAGETIFVRSGTYNESAITNSLNNITIIGESRETTIINVPASADILLSGNNVTVINCRIQTNNTATSRFRLTGSYALVYGNHFSTSRAGTMCNFTGGYAIVSNNTFETTVIMGSDALITLADALFSNNYLLLANGQTDTSSGILSLGSKTTVTDNIFDVASETSSILNCAYIYVNGNDCAVLNNRIFARIGKGYGVGVRISSNASHTTVSGNSFYDLFKGVDIKKSYALINNNFIRLNKNSNDIAIGIQISTTSQIQCIINNNYINGSNGSGAFYKGIELSNSCEDIQISNNSIYYCEAGAIINGTSVRTKITDNFIRFSSTITMDKYISDSGTMTHSMGNGAAITEEKTQVVMKNTSGGSLTAGSLVVLKNVAAGNEITTTTTAGDDKVFGVVSETIANNEFGYIQTLGKVTTLKADGTTDIAIGDFLTSFTTAGIAAKATTGDMVFAIALEAYTADNSSGVIDAMLITPRLI